MLPFLSVAIATTPGTRGDPDVTLFKMASIALCRASVIGSLSPIVPGPLAAQRRAMDRSVRSTIGAARNTRARVAAHRPQAHFQPWLSIGSAIVCKNGVTGHARLSEDGWRGKRLPLDCGWLRRQICG